MKKNKTQFICTNCNYISTQWMGKCPSCHTWNSLEAFDNHQKSTTSGRYNKTLNKFSSSSSELETSQAILASTLKPTEDCVMKTGFYELDRVLGGGVTIGSMNLLTGMPGIGKSTLLASLLNYLSPDLGILYICAEENVNQVFKRLKRLNISHPKLFLYHESCWENIYQQIVELKPSFLILDSIQTVYSEELNSSIGSVSQVKEVCFELLSYIKPHGITAFITGHITKDGQVAGPKVLEHMVDCSLSFEGKSESELRFLRVSKNRFGSTQEVGLFEMGESGITELKSEMLKFMESDTPSEGRVLTIQKMGDRVNIVEIQSLVKSCQKDFEKRLVQGFDSNRLILLIAIIEKYLDLKLHEFDIFLNIAHGLTLKEPQSDLAIVASLLSSILRVKIDPKYYLVGELSLSGAIRPNQTKFRTLELSRLGYKDLGSEKGFKSISCLYAYLDSL